MESLLLLLLALRLLLMSWCLMLLLGHLLHRVLLTAPFLCGWIHQPSSACTAARWHVTNELYQYDGSGSPLMYCCLLTE